MKRYIKPENWIHGMSLEKKGLLKSQMKSYKSYLPKWWSIVIWILAAIVLCGNQLI